MAGVDNLVPFSKRSVEEARELGRKGGKASVATRRRQKSIRETLKEMLSSEIPKGSDFYRQAKSKLKMIGITKSPNVQDALNIGILQAALKGNIRAAEFVRDTIGEKPTDSFEDKTPRSPFILGVVPKEMVEKAEAVRRARQAEDEQQQQN